MNHSRFVIVRHYKKHHSCANYWFDDGLNRGWVGDFTLAKPYHTREEAQEMVDFIVERMSATGHEIFDPPHVVEVSLKALLSKTNGLRKIHVLPPGL